MGKGKKKIKASNLNKDTTTAKPEETKANKKSTEDDAWEEEEVKASTIKGVESAGTLKKEAEIKDAEDTAAPAWGPLKTSKELSNTGINEKKYPTLQKAVGSSSININDEPKVNIATSKNVFAALETGEDDDEEQSTKRPNQINAIMVSKKKGEREKEAVEREVKKYTGSAKESKKDANKKATHNEDEDEEEDDDDEEEEGEDPDGPAAVGEVKKKKQPEKKDTGKDEKKAKKEVLEERNEEIEEDLQIVFDTEASKAKYKGRKKLSPKEIPPEELEEEKENRPKAQAKVTSGKKKKFMAEEEQEKKIMYMPDDW